MTRDKCRGCQKKNLQKFLDLGNMPLAGGFLSGPEAIQNEKAYPLPVHVCSDCGLVQILEVIDPEILFQDYSFSSSTISALVQHFEKYAQWLNVNYHPKFVVEFGCNDGVLLEPLIKLGIKACGVDVSRNISDIACSKGLDVIPGYFGKELAQELLKKHGPADIVTGSNAFAHNDCPEKILEGASILLKPDGYLCLEVMYAGDLLETYQWDTLYHEHLTFYSITSLKTLLDKYDFTVVDAERIPMHGGSIRVVASKSSSTKITENALKIIAYENSIRISDPDTWMKFGHAMKRKVSVVKETLERLSKSSRIWGYGAAGKATMWVNACAMDYLEAMVDASPLRAGKLMPGTHTPIVFPEKLKENPPDYIFVTAWNYVEGIRAKESWYQGTWITPLPELRFF